MWYQKHKYFLLAHSSLVALVDRLPSRLAGILLVKHFHLRVPKSPSIMSPEERTHAHEATLAHTAYLVVALKAHFCLYGNAYPPTLPLLSRAWYRISVVLATQISPFLAHSSQLVLVDRQPSRLAGIVVVNHEGGYQNIFLSQAHQVHRGHTGGWQYPLPTMPPF